MFDDAQSYGVRQTKTGGCQPRSDLPQPEPEANVVVCDGAFAWHLSRCLEHLMWHGCQCVRLLTPGPLRSAWIALRNLVVFDVLLGEERRFDWCVRER
ncbi:hypothetical protein FQZ97_1068440 [compost metagenome]